MADEKFVDAVGDIVNTGMVVRFDLLALDPTTRDKDGNMKQVLRQRVVMPIDGFVNAVQKLSNALPQLEKMGVLKRSTTNGQAEEVATLDSALDTKTNEPPKRRAKVNTVPRFDSKPPGDT